MPGARGKGGGWLVQKGSRAGTRANTQGFVPLTSKQPKLRGVHTKKALHDLNPTETAQFIPGSVQGCCHQRGFPVFQREISGNPRASQSLALCPEHNKAATRIDGVRETLGDKPPPVLLPH